MFKFSIDLSLFTNYKSFFEKAVPVVLALMLVALSVSNYLNYYHSGLGISYNDARSHLDIGRRVVEGLKPGLAQLGSVWLPLTHLLMVPTIWNDFMWHSGLSGALESMSSFVVTGLVIYLYLGRLKVGLFGRVAAVAVFAANMNILYLQSTAMTELPLLATMTLGCYSLLVWHQEDKIIDLIKAAFWIMLSTLIRYDGWFLLAASSALVLFQSWRRNNYKVSEGTVLIFLTLSGFGVVLWLLWNQLIFKDPLYFAFGPFSAHAQQEQLNQAGVLATKGNLWLSLKIYLYALMYNSYTVSVIVAAAGAVYLWFDKRVSSSSRFASLALLAPFVFNVLALYLGHSVLFVQGLSGDTWFNVRYGIMLWPSIAILVGYVVGRLPHLRWPVLGILAIIVFFAFVNKDAVTIDDAQTGASQKNVSEVAGWLLNNTSHLSGYILISAASHDAVIFSSGLPMKRFIHEGTGAYWESATANPDRWARWIVMRSYDDNDATWKLVHSQPGFKHYSKIDSYPFADIYELKPEYLPYLETREVFKGQK